jgi:hypothetical protein
MNLANHSTFASLPHLDPLCLQPVLLELLFLWRAVVALHHERPALPSTESPALDAPEQQAPLA